MTAQTAKSFATFAELYPFYLGEHADRRCRRLHFIGSCLVLCVLFGAGIAGNAWPLLGVPVAGYGFAWFGHFVFEGNKPATFTHPVIQPDG
jgi:hypothetical protein